jgi:uncharacterized protein
MVFVDTGAWFALSVSSDPDHEAVKRFIADNREPLVTSDYVIDELLTLFVVRQEKATGVIWLRDVLEAGAVDVVKIDGELFAEACRIYAQFFDKAWSFTDCTSYSVIQRLRIGKTLSFDGHFRQFGTVQVLP